MNTVEPRLNEVAGDRPNLFVKSRVRYIENLHITNLRGNDHNVRYIEVIVNDWFVTQVTSVTQFNAIFVTQKCSVLRCNSLKAWWLSVSIIFTFEQTSSFCLQKNDTFQGSNLKMLQNRGYTENCLCKQGKGFSVVMLHYPTFPDFKEDRAEVNWSRNTIVPMSMTYK